MEIKKDKTKLFLFLGLLFVFTISFLSTYISWTKVEASSGTSCSHSWKPATCTSPKICSKCGTKSGKSDGHSYAYEDQDDGMHKSYCSKCGIRFSQAYHTFGSWKTTSNPTCTSYGSKVRYCTYCGASETMRIDKAPHNWSDWHQSQTQHWKECNNCDAEKDRGDHYDNNIDRIL